MSGSYTASAKELSRSPQLPGEFSSPVRLDTPNSHATAVSWGAILAGAAAAAALSLILLILGTGLGLSSISPWASSGVTATTLGVSTIVWLTFTQIAASALGGYLAGRLRTRWFATHADEVYFRDTAHGFLAWAVASLVTAALLSSAIGSIISGGVQAGATAAAGVASGKATALRSTNDSTSMSETMTPANPLGYFVDSLFRRDNTAAGTQLGLTGDAPTAEVARILLSNIRSEKMPADDTRYLAQIVAQRTGLTQPEAEKRVNDIYARAQTNIRAAEVAAKDAAEKARKAAAYASLWLFVSLLSGAFIASLSATYGGRRRDA